MKSTLRALQVLQASAHRREAPGVLAAVAVWVFLCAAAYGRGLFTVDYVVAGALGVLALGECKVLSTVIRGGLLEPASLTGFSPRQWSDGLVLQAFKRLGAGLLLAVLAPAWLPVAVLTILTGCYAAQVQAASGLDRPGRELSQLLSGLLFFAIGYEELDAWAFGRWIPLLVACGVMLGCRQWVIYRLGRLMQPEAVSTGGRLRRGVRAWSRNPIVIRESRRALRRGWLPLFLKRYGILLLFLWVVFTQVEDVGVGRGPWYLYYNDCADTILSALRWYAFLAIGVSYLASLSAVYGERQQQTAVLLQTSPLPARDYVQGWASWVTRPRVVELVAVYVAGLGTVAGCLWAETGYNLTGWTPGSEAARVQMVETVIALGLITVLLTGAFVYIALVASRHAKSWGLMQLEFLKWMLPYLLGEGLIWLWTQGHPVWTLTGQVALTAWLAWKARRQAWGAVADGLELLGS